MTFSIVARSSDRTLFGVAIVSSSPAVAARCAHARAGAGAVATQNITDPRLGPQVLEALGRGATARGALEQALAATPFAAYRQLLAVCASGPPAVHSGSGSLGTVASELGQDAAAAGNLLASPEVPAAMVEAFSFSKAVFGARLIEALKAGLARGGEAGPVHSAGLLIVRDQSWPIADLRIDWSDSEPVAALNSLWERYAPQLEDYVCRALDPARAPRFG
jgi:uncharacterized Ntn-hydrolase superfamily protein